MPTKSKIEQEYSEKFDGLIVLYDLLVVEIERLKNRVAKLEEQADAKKVR